MTSYPFVAFCCWLARCSLQLHLHLLVRDALRSAGRCPSFIAHHHPVLIGIYSRRYDVCKFSSAPSSGSAGHSIRGREHYLQQTSTRVRHKKSNCFMEHYFVLFLINLQKNCKMLFITFEWS